MRQHIGIEIEGIVNGKALKLSRLPYHSNRKTHIKNLNKWFVECDGSISLTSDLPEEFRYSGLCCEFVSKKFLGKKHLIKGLEQFKSFLSQNGKHELNEVIQFNNTCGCHVHISTNHRFREKGDFRILVMARELFFKKIKASNIKSKQEILKHYFRSYAKRVNKDNWISGRREFNGGSEGLNLGFEWRSINMLGVNTWAEFDEFFNIIWDCADFLTKKLLRYKFKTSIYPKAEITTGQEKINIQENKEEVEIINTEKNPDFETEKIIYDVTIKKSDVLKPFSSRDKYRNDYIRDDNDNWICNDCLELIDLCQCDRCSNCDLLLNNCCCEICSNCDRLTDYCECETCSNCGEYVNECYCDEDN